MNSTENQKTQVFVKVTILSVGPFTELDMKFNVKFLFQVFYKEHYWIDNHIK